MMVSTKGRYALRVMIELAGSPRDEYRPLKEMAERQQISIKYLEAIVALLVKAGFVDGMRGKGGGYRLTREPREYNVWEILISTEGSLVPVSCLENGCEPCERASSCATLPMWNHLNDLIREYLESVSLSDLMEQARALQDQHPVI